MNTAHERRTELSRFYDRFFDNAREFSGSAFLNATMSVVAHLFGICKRGFEELGATSARPLFVHIRLVVPESSCLCQVFGPYLGTVQLFLSTEYWFCLE